MTVEEDKPSTTFDQLGLDSLDRMEVTLTVEQQFGFHGDQVPVAIGQLWMLAQGLVERAPPKPPPALWFRPAAETGLCSVLGETIPEAFVARAGTPERRCSCRRSVRECYERMLIRSLVLARRFATIPGTNVGLFARLGGV